MERDPRAYLWDVQQAAEAIGQFVGGLDAAGYAQTRLSGQASSASSRSSAKR
jgi:uncharacterized protein with HEPN domain